MYGCPYNCVDWRRERWTIPMTPVELSVILFAVSIVAGLFGSLLGLGGGVVVVPVLTLGFGVDIRLAIGASVVAVVATSVAAAPGNLESGWANLRIAIVLAVATTLGALTGAWLSGRLDPRVLYAVFGGVLALAGFEMGRKLRRTLRSAAAVHDASEERVVFEASEVAAGRITDAPVLSQGCKAEGDAPRRRTDLSGRLGLGGTYPDRSSGREIAYGVDRPLLGLSLMYVAGTVGGLLGIGSGVLKVPAMDVAMRLPLKVSMATSNLLIGVTAASASVVYLLRGDVDPYLAGPVAAGVLLGAWAGGRLLPRLASAAVGWVFVGVVVVVSCQMLWKGIA